MELTREMRMISQASLNGMHIYCRLRDMGISKKWAARFARFCERIINPIIY